MIDRDRADHTRRRLLEHEAIFSRADLMLSPGQHKWCRCRCRPLSCSSPAGVHHVAIAVAERDFAAEGRSPRHLRRCRGLSSRAALAFTVSPAPLPRVIVPL